MSTINASGGISRKQLKMYERAAIPIRLGYHSGSMFDVLVNGLDTEARMFELLASFKENPQVSPIRDVKTRTLMLSIYRDYETMRKKIRPLHEQAISEITNYSQLRQLKRATLALVAEFNAVYKRYQAIMPDLGGARVDQVVSEDDPAVASLSYKEYVLAGLTELSLLFNRVIKNFSVGKLVCEQTKLRSLVEQAKNSLAQNDKAFMDMMLINRVPENHQLKIDAVMFMLAVARVLSNQAHYVGQINKVLVTAENKQGHSILKIEDDGPGFLPGMLAVSSEMGRPNALVLNQTTRDSTGMGLSFLWNVVWLHRGGVEISNNSSLKPGGAAFVIRLPNAA
ncbi:MAG: hypothetical protein PHH14_00020 [Candidatus Margulisbacteria bacterium]|nr:hypothetical protein [Candidatus Margulisiibacteriota bacterium]